MTKCTLVLIAVVAACDVDQELVEQGTQAVAVAGSPNIIVVMTDDLDVASMDTLRQLGMVPNIQDHILGEAVDFRNSFVSNSLCCPSRATFLTGQYSHNNHVLTSKGVEELSGVEALDDTSTLATWMQDAGYRTGHVGKYLNGYGKNRYSSIPQFWPHYVPPGWDHWQALVGASTYNTFDYNINNAKNGRPKIVHYGFEPQDYQTTVLAGRAAQFIRDSDRDDAQPFFLVVTPLAPHSEGDRDVNQRWSKYLDPDPNDLLEKPDQVALLRSLLPTSFAAPSFDQRDPNRPSWMFTWAPRLSDTDKANLTSFYRDRLVAMLAVDDLVGTIWDTLVEFGEIDNTIIIFTSDNGYLFGEHRLSGKAVAYEESIRVPLFIRIPGAPPVAVDQLVVNIDLAPTITSLGGVQAGLAMDGRSLEPLFAGGETPWRRRFLLEHWKAGATARLPTYAGLRTTDHSYVQFFDDIGSRELFDMGQDPFQTANVWGAVGYETTGAQLEALLPAMRECANGSCQLLDEQ